MRGGKPANRDSAVSSAGFANARGRAASGAAPATTEASGGTGADQHHNFFLNGDQRAVRSGSGGFRAADLAASRNAHIG
jgi:hypothetical protein